MSNSNLATRLDSRPYEPTRGNDRYDLPFPEAEFTGRLERFQQELRHQGVAGVFLFDPENIFWLTGYQTIGYFTFSTLYVPVNGKPWMVARIVNRELARSLPTLGDFFAIRDTEEPIEVLHRFVACETGPGDRIALDTSSWYLTVADHARIVQYPDRTFVDWKPGFIERERMVKDDLQLDRVQRAADAAVAGLDAAIREIAAGKTENDVAAAMMDASIRAGSEYLGHPPLVVAGKRSGRCFSMWRRSEIREGDVVVLESAGCVDRYHAMVSRPVVVGQPTRQQQFAADGLQGVLESAVEAIRPGITAGEVDAQCRAVVEKLGLGDYFKHRAAYGIGIGFPPNWSEGKIYAIRPGDPLILQPGMTFHIIPTLFLEEFGMCFSDSVRVTETGCEVMTPYPRKLFVK